MKFVSKKYPELVVADVGVKFVDGKIETDDPVVIARLETLGALGVSPDGADPAPAVPSAESAQEDPEDEEPETGEDTPVAPSVRDGKDAWVAYAVALGHAVDESLTKREIIELVG